MIAAARPVAMPLSIAICVPARDEAQRLPRLFAAIEALDMPDDAAVRLCLMLDGCTDDSAAIAEAYRLRSPHRVQVGVAAWGPPNAGRARGRAMQLGLACLGSTGILLTTDADSVPDRDWLRAMVAGLHHADIVAGNVVRSGGGSGGDQDRIERYYAGLFLLRRAIDPVGWEAPQPHHHASGANMGMRAETYCALGGFAPLERGEDARLIDDAARAGLRVRRDAASVVHTSERRMGRVQGGLATMLCNLDRDGLAGVSVAHPGDQAWQYRMQALARTAYANHDFIALSGGVGLTVDHLLGVARDCPNDEAFAMSVVPEPPGGMRHIAFTAAEAMLAAMTASVPPAAAA